MDHPSVTINDLPNEVPSVNINNLPNEILLKIFSHLSVEDLGLRVQYVCTRWYEVCLDDILWKNAFFSTREKTNVEYILSVLEKVPKLQCFCIWFRSSAEVLQKLADCCKNLRRLVFCIPQLENCNEAFDSILTECTKLEELTIPGGALASDELAKSVGKCKNLRALYLIGRSENPIILKYIADGCVSLQYLDMRNMEWQYSDMKYFLEQKQSKLFSLSVSPVTYNGVCIVPLLEVCKDNLNKLQLEDGRYCYIDDSTFNMITKLSSLRSLSLRIHRGVKADVMANIFLDGAMAQLTEVEINNSVELNGALVRIICKNCPNLLKLGLKYSIYLNDDGLRFLHKCTRLEEIDLYYCILLTDAGMDHVFKCTNLKYLNIGFCKVTWKSLSRVIELPQLKQLDLDACDVAGLPLDMFPLCLKKLRKLKLDYCFNTNDDALDVLRAQMPHLSISAVTAQRCP